VSGLDGFEGPGSWTAAGWPRILLPPCPDDSPGERPLRQPSAELLGQCDDDALGAAGVTEPIAVLVLLQLANEFGAVGVRAGKDVSMSSTANMTRRMPSAAGLQSTVLDGDGCRRWRGLTSLRLVTQAWTVLAGRTSLTWTFAAERVGGIEPPLSAWELAVDHAAQRVGQVRCLVSAGGHWPGGTVVLRWLPWRRACEGHTEGTFVIAGDLQTEPSLG